MKKHGLWVFHRYARIVQDRTGWRWWLDADIERVRDGLHWYQSSFERISNASVVMRCASRFLRMHGRTSVRMSEWVALCDLIAKRVHFTHPMTVGVYKERGEARRKSLLHWPGGHDSLGGPEAKYYRGEVHERWNGIFSAHLRRKEAERKEKLKSLIQVHETRAAIREINKHIKVAQEALKGR